MSVNTTEIESMEKHTYALETAYLELLQKIKENDIEGIKDTLDQYKLSYLNALEYLNPKDKKRYYDTIQSANNKIRTLQNAPIKIQIDNNSPLREDDPSVRSLKEDIETSFLKVNKALITGADISSLQELMQELYFTILNAGSAITPEEFANYKTRSQSLLTRINEKNNSRNQTQTYTVNGKPIRRVRFPGHETPTPFKN